MLSGGGGMFWTFIGLGGGIDWGIIGGGRFWGIIEEAITGGGGGGTL